MEKIKLFKDKKSIKRTFIFYILGCLLAALFLSLVSSLLCQMARNRIYLPYQTLYLEETEDKMTLDYANQTGRLYLTIADLKEQFTERELFLYEIFAFLGYALVPMWFILCITLTSLLFYRHILKPPLEILDLAAADIANNNLDFSIIYQRNDEMGRLCASFEKMRQALQENNINTWRQMEERKQLNAAFSHDLRTPLTVLKGQGEMLVKYAEDKAIPREKIAATTTVMNRHIKRLENYVAAMSRLQRLEDLEIHPASCKKAEVCKALTESGRILCRDLEFRLDAANLEPDAFSIDLDIIVQVYENLLSNSLRFAKKRILVRVSMEKYFIIRVWDDGPGFAEADLNKVTQPFYRSVKGQDDQHFGMGLHICSILCKKHGGYLKISNVQGKAMVEAAFAETNEPASRHLCLE